MSGFLTNTEVTAEGKLRVKSSGREYSLLFLEREAEKRFAGCTSWDGVEKKCFDLVREYAKKGLRVGKSSLRTRYFEIASGGGDGVMASCRRAGDATPCQAIRSLQGPPCWGSVAPRRTFAAIAQNQRKSGAREKSEWKMTF